MAVLTIGLTQKSLNEPDEVRSLPKTTVNVVTIGEHTVMRARFEPGWRWSECVKPAVGTDLCEVPHLNYHISGRLRIRMSDGTEFEAKPGDLTEVPPGHDAWVVGSEPVVVLDFIGAKSYAK